MFRGDDPANSSAFKNLNSARSVNPVKKKRKHRDPRTREQKRGRQPRHRRESAGISTQPGEPMSNSGVGKVGVGGMKSAHRRRRKVGDVQRGQCTADQKQRDNDDGNWEGGETELKDG